MEKLYYATDLFTKKGDGGHEGAKIACLAIKDFIGVRHENPELAMPFIAIAQAFEDIERDVSPDLFSKNVEQKKRSRSTEHRRLQVLAASLLDILISLDRLAGEPKGRDRLAAFVARHVQKWPGMSSVEGSP